MFSNLKNDQKDRYITFIFQAYASALYFYKGKIMHFDQHPVFQSFKNVDKVNTFLALTHTYYSNF